MLPATYPTYVALSTRKTFRSQVIIFLCCSQLNIGSPTLLRRHSAVLRPPSTICFLDACTRTRTYTKMSRVGRPRRTRVYDCNYDKGESYYRPVLDRLDGKTPIPKEPERDRVRSDVENRIKSALDDMEAPQDDFFDSRGARAHRGRPLSSALEDDELTEDITESLKRLRASKKSSRFAEDVDFDNSVANLENRMRISDKILETVGIGSSEVSGARRALQENEERTEKRISRRLQQAQNEESHNSLTKWTALKNVEEESAASQRMKATRARLNDLEDEMSELSERTAAREKRAARLRALVADSDCADTSVAATKVTIRAEKEKKTVSF